MRIIRRHEKDFTVFFDLLAETLEEKISPLYSPIMENFYAQRLNEKSAILANLSFIVEENSVPLFCFLGIVINTENTKKMSFYQNPSISFSNRKITTRKQSKFFLNEINRLLDQFKPLRVEFLDYNFNNIISEFSNFLLSEQIKPKLLYSHSIRLSLPIDKIKSNLRKSYKALIDPRKNGLTLELFDKSNVSFKDILEFQNLHENVSGKKTMSNDAWEERFKIIKSGNGFMIKTFHEMELISIGMYTLYKNLCYYASSATNRAYLNKSVFHSSMWEAINYLKNSGCKKIHLGEKLFYSVDKKEKTISDFKSGFSDSLEINLLFIFDRH